MLIYLFLCVGTCIPRCTCRGQRITCGSQFSPSTMWVLEIKLRNDQTQIIRDDSKALYVPGHLFGPHLSFVCALNVQSNLVATLKC